MRRQVVFVLLCVRFSYGTRNSTTFLCVLQTLLGPRHKSYIRRISLCSSRCANANATPSIVVVNHMCSQIDRKVNAPIFATAVEPHEVEITRDEFQQRHIR